MCNAAAKWGGGSKSGLAFKLVNSSGSTVWPKVVALPPHDIPPGRDPPWPTKWFMVVFQVWQGQGVAVTWGPDDIP